MPVLVLASLLTAMLSGGVRDQNRVSAPVRVLLVTGQDIPAHDWKATAPVLKRLLEDDGRCVVRVVESPDVLATPNVFDCDVVLLHFRNETPLPHEAQARANLQRLLQEGRGLVLVHFACGAFADWPGFGEIAGMVWDTKNTHDAHGPFQVRIVDSRHPITAGMTDFPTDDELYIGLAQHRPVDVLAVARSKVTGRDHPMAFAFQSGKGRVFQTPLGHDVKALQMPGVAELIRRGCQWAAGRTPVNRTTAAASFDAFAIEQPTPYQCVVKSGAQTLLEYTFAPDQIKPYIRELASLGGENLLRDSPFDHKHHHALMFAMKVNGVNFWEETPGCGHERPAGPLRVEIDRSRGSLPPLFLHHQIEWVAASDADHPRSELPPLLIEDRALGVALDESLGEFALLWSSRFKVAPGVSEVTLSGTNYHGLGMRFRQDLDPLVTHIIAGTQPDLSGAKQDVRPAAWGAVAFNAAGKPATIAVFASPYNPGGATRFFSMKHPFAYLSATAGLDQQPLKYKSNETFAFEYVIAVYPEVKSADFLVERGKSWTARLQEKNP